MFFYIVNHFHQFHLLIRHNSSQLSPSALESAGDFPLKVLLIAIPKGLKTTDPDQCFASPKIIIPSRHQSRMMGLIMFTRELDKKAGETARDNSLIVAWTKLAETAAKQRDADQFLRFMEIIEH
jgi:hypothetical protein